jgi:hypothetical protein
MGARGLGGTEGSCCDDFIFLAAVQRRPADNRMNEALR